MSRNELTMSIAKALAICLGVSLLVGNGTQAEEPTEEQVKLYPVSLNCPTENNQVAERVAQNRLGGVQHITVRYLDGVPTLVTITGRSKGRAPKVYLQSDIRTETDPDAKEYAEDIVKTFFKAICEGPPEKRREYFSTLKANRRLLGLQ